jgi:dTDP-4-dehydrorhamnose 3,5-epimerase
VLDVVVDIRVGSPTYGTWDAVRLDDAERAAVYCPRASGTRSWR